MKLLIPAVVLASLVFAPMTRGQEAEATAVPSKTATPAAPSPAAQPAKTGPITVTVDLIGGQRITGALTDLGAIPVRASWGPAEIPIPEVAGVKFASNDDPTTTIIMKNGDSLTVATDMKAVSVDTEWGQARVNGSAILSMLFIPDLKWTASIGLNGKRWSLVDAKTNTPAGPAIPGVAGTVPANNPGARPVVSPGQSR